MALRLQPGEARPLNVLRSEICWQTLACISQRQRTQSVPGGDVAAALDAAWKTGTSNGLRDAWCAAVTRRLVVVVWLGNASGRGSSELVGQEAAAPVALKLLGQIDPGGESWPPVTLAKDATRVLAANTRLSVVTPVSGAEIFASTEDGHPAVALQSAGGAGVARWWFANGQLVAINQAGKEGGPTAWWHPDAGAYELRVVDESGVGAVVRVSIR